MKISKTTKDQKTMSRRLAKTATRIAKCKKHIPTKRFIKGIQDCYVLKRENNPTSCLVQKTI